MLGDFLGWTFLLLGSLWRGVWALGLGGLK